MRVTRGPSTDYVFLHGFTRDIKLQIADISCWCEMNNNGCDGSNGKQHHHHRQQQAGWRAGRQYYRWKILHCEGPKRNVVLLKMPSDHKSATFYALISVWKYWLFGRFFFYMFDKGTWLLIAEWMNSMKNSQWKLWEIYVTGFCWFYRLNHHHTVANK